MNLARWYVSTLLALSCVGLATALAWQPVGSALPKVDRTPPPERQAKVAPVFQEVTLELGLMARHRQSAGPLGALTETLGGGLCAIDFDRDGWVDVFTIGGSGHTRHYGAASWWHRPEGNRLFRNRGGRGFEDITADSGLDAPLWGMGCTAADFNNDGFTDLIVTGVGAIAVFQNDGQGGFADVTRASGINSNEWNMGMSAADFDGDGLLDLYVSRYVAYARDALTFERNSGFEAGSSTRFDATLHDPVANLLYRNTGQFRFEDVTDQMGVANARGRSLGARWIDANQDAWPDLLVLNDRGSPNVVFLNGSGSAFTSGDEGFAAFNFSGTRDVASADLDNDGRDEYLFSRPPGMPTVLLMGQSGSARNYRDRALAWGAGGPRQLAYSGWGALLADFSNDGLPDLFIAQGLMTPDLDAPYAPQSQPDGFFVNEGRRFINAHSSLGMSQPQSSRGAISVDLNNDGRLEVIVSTNNGPLHAFQNIGGTGSWLGLDFLQRSNEASTYGAKVTVETPTKAILRTLKAPGAYLSHGDPRMHIGLGEETEVRSVRVEWRDGGTTLFNPVSVNRYYGVDRAAGLLHPSGASARPKELPDFKLDDLALIELARLLLAASADERESRDTRARMIQIWRSMTPRGRTGLMQSLADHTNPRNNTIIYQQILHRGLADSSTSVKLAAVRLMGRVETDDSVDGLIPLLEDPDARVTCAVADVFRAFHDEEEAATHRKNVTISPLVRRLDPAYGEPLPCVIDALGAAENSRAVHTLVKLLGSDSGTAVRTSAALALGRIRDGRAIPALRAQVEGGPPPLMAASLIALSRLADANVAELLTSFLPHASHAHRFAAIASLLTDPAGAVFSRETVLDVLDRLLSENVDGTAAGPERMLAIAAAKSPRFENTILDLTTAEGPTAVGMLALAAIGSPRTQQRFASSFNQLSAQATSDLTNRMLNAGLVFPADIVNRIAGRTGTAHLAFDILAHIEPERANGLLDKLIRPSVPSGLLHRLLSWCVEAGYGTTFSNFPEALEHPDLPLRVSAIQCYFQASHNDSTASPNLRHRALSLHLLRSLDADKAIDAATRTRLLIAASASSPLVATTALKRAWSALPSGFMAAALTAIDKAGVTNEFQSELQAAVSETSWPAEARLRAARLLVNINGEDALIRQAIDSFLEVAGLTN